MWTRLFLFASLFGMSIHPGPLVAAPAAPGQPAPPWELTDLAGGRVRLSDLAGRVVLLNFFRSNCVPCLWEIPDLNRLQETYGSEGLVIVGVGVEEPADTLQPFVVDQGIDYSVCLSTETVLWDYHVYPLGAIPLTVLIDRSGAVADWYRYYQTYSFHESNLLPLLADAAPQLSIAPLDGAWEISWAAPAAGYVLETRPTLKPSGAWHPVDEEVEQTGQRLRVIVPSAAANAFFRLRRL